MAARFSDKVAANLATNYAMSAAASYFAAKGRTATEEDAVALGDALADELTAAIPEALDDVKEALDAHMGEAAVATFAASMRLAGIRAAKKVIG